MNKKIKKLFAITLGLAITASSAMSMSVSATKISSLTDYTIVDDKGLMANYSYKEYKVIYDDQYDTLIIADPNIRIAQFFLSEDVNYEEANERIIEIFKEFYPDNYLDVPECPPNNEGYPAYIEYCNNYAKNYKPNLWSYTIDGVTVYTLCALDRQMPSIEGEKIAEAKKYSKAFMEKLNEEKLISAFYDFGEVYDPEMCRSNFQIAYSSDVDIDLICNYIDEHNIDCTVKKVYKESNTDYYYKLEFNDDTTRLEQFLIAVDIYEATSIKIAYLARLDTWRYDFLYGKNSLEEIFDVTTSKEVKLAGDANGDNKITIRDCLFIARKIARREGADLPNSADYNMDGKKNIKDAADLAKAIAKRKI